MFIFESHGSLFEFLGFNLPHITFVRIFFYGNSVTPSVNRLTGYFQQFLGQAGILTGTGSIDN